MRRSLLSLSFLALFTWAARAEAVEYRLQVVNLDERAFMYYVEGRIGRGEGELALDRLERSLDGGQVPRAALLGDRPFRPASESVAKGYGAVRVRAEVKPLEGGRRWEEAVWDGNPGERSLWLIATTTTNHQEAVHLGLGGKDGLRYYIPYTVNGGAKPLVALTYPLQFLQFHEERGTLWDRYLGRALSFERGIAAVVGVNQAANYADWVYILVEHPATPTTFKVAVGWAHRPRTQDMGPGNVPDD